MMTYARVKVQEVSGHRGLVGRVPRASGCGLVPTSRWGQSTTYQGSLLLILSTHAYYYNIAIPKFPVIVLMLSCRHGIYGKVGP